MKKGNIGVTTENIFPIIKKFLYSDHEIFLREIVSNAVDATQKLKTLSAIGEFKGELGELYVKVDLDKENKTITITDRGIGLTAEEIDKYINQIAFSGANDFLDKYKDDANAIIGHFGLGFYSSFMVSKQVDIISLSHKEGAKAVKWSCDGSPEYTLEEVEKEDRGTQIVLHIDKESEEFLEKERLSTLLEKYCSFLPVKIAFGNETIWKDGKEEQTDKLNIINDMEPIWTRSASELKDEDYIGFYKKLYPMSDDPLFWIHLNVDYPFNLTGVLYFPKIKTNVELTRNKIQLYSNQVYVTDSVEGIVPDFLTLLHGVIDSPDIPLNVSRSYLQSDSNVKKISSHITKKVADRLQQIFRSDRKEFEEKWDNLKLFINYGMLTQEDFYDRASKFALLGDTDGKYYTFEEYQTLIKENQTDKEDTLIYLYTNNIEEQFGFIEAAKNKGYNVLLLNDQLDVGVIGLLEQKFEKSRFTRVDSDVIDNIIVKEDQTETVVEADTAEALSATFKSQLPKMEKTEFYVQTQALGEETSPVMITQNESMRRMKDMAAIQQGMSFYGEMPNMFTVVLNADHELIKKVLEETQAAVADEIKPIATEIEEISSNKEALTKSHEGKKEEEIAKEEQEKINELNIKIGDLKGKKDGIYANHAAKNKVVRQLIDLALLQNNMLKGEALSKFVKRSIDLI